MTGSTPGAFASRVLQEAHLFSGIDEAAVAGLARAGRFRRLAKGQILFSQGDPSDDFYVVASGRIALLLGSADGRELVINQMNPGEGFGELGLLTGGRRSTSAVARQPTVVIAIPRREFLAAVEAQPSLARRLLETTAQRLDAASDREGALAFLAAPARLARVLLLLDRQAAAEGFVTISQEELAQHTGLVRQSVASLLGQWRRRGWVVTGRGRIVLLDRTALRSQAEGDQP